MSVSKGIWSGWKPVNENYKHGLDIEDIKAQVEIMIGKVDVFIDYEYREYKEFSKDGSIDIKSLQLVVKIKDGCHELYGYFAEVHIEMHEGKPKVVRVNNKMFPGLNNTLQVVGGQDDGKHVTFVDDYPIQSPFAPATKSIQGILDKLFPVSQAVDVPIFKSIPNAKITALSFICRILATGREYLVLAYATQGNDSVQQQQRSDTNQYIKKVGLLTIHGKGKNYTLRSAVEVPDDRSLLGGFGDWLAMTKDVEDAALLVQDKVMNKLKELNVDSNTYEPRRYRSQLTPNNSKSLQIEIKVKKNVVQGSRESFAQMGVVIVKVYVSEGCLRYESISDLQIVPSTVNELIYFPTDWSLVIDGDHDVNHLLTKFYKQNYQVAFWKIKYDNEGILVKALVDVKDDKLGKNFELVEIRTNPPFPNEDSVLVSRTPVKFA